jgi:hypothetical protein
VTPCRNSKHQSILKLAIAWLVVGVVVGDERLPTSAHKFIYERVLGPGLSGAYRLCASLTCTIGKITCSDVCPSSCNS